MTNTPTPIESRVDAIEKLHLYVGSHNADEVGERMCAMEVVAWIAGEPHSDHPECASVTISAFMRAWNDGLADDDRNRLLKPFLARMVGSAGTPEQERERSMMALRWHNGVMLPAFLDLVDSLRPHAEAVRADPLNGGVIRAAAASAATQIAASFATQITASGATGATGSAAGLAASKAASEAASKAASAAASDTACFAAGLASRIAASGATLAAATVASGDASRIAASDAARIAARIVATSAAWDAARAAAGERLSAVVSDLQISATELLDEMLKVTELDADPSVTK